MKTILYFQSSYCESNNTEAASALSYAETVGWQMRIIPYSNAAANRLHGEARTRKKPPIAKLASFWKADGAIVDCGAAVGLLKPRDFGSLPVVFLESPPVLGVPRVSSDGRAIGECAARELLTLGFPRYAYIPWITPLTWSKERGTFFTDCIRMNGLPLVPFEWHGAHNEETMQQELQSWFNTISHPLAIFAANDYIASLVISCACRARLHVPKDISVLGVDDDPRICTGTRPTISSIRPDYEKAGWSAAMLLDEVMKRPETKTSEITFGVDRVNRRESSHMHIHRNQGVVSAQEIIRRAAIDGIGAAEVSAQVNCSRRLLELRFKEATGRSLLQEIRSIRIAHARRLLAYTNKPLPDVAHQCGYKSVVTFRKAFYTEMRKTPRDYRQQAQIRR